MNDTTKQVTKQAANGAINNPVVDPGRILNAKDWRRANRALLAKILSEFMYESMIAPEIVEQTGKQVLFKLKLGEDVTYSFTATARECFGFYRVHETGILRSAGAEAPAEPDSAFTLVGDIHRALRLNPNTTAKAVHELSNTLYADCFMLNRPEADISDWLSKSGDLLEGELNAHPWIVANKSRLGFGIADGVAYAPESRKPFRLIWTAVHRTWANFNAAGGRTYQDYINNELPETDIHRFHEVLTSRGLNTEDYYFIPVHPWQYENRIVHMFAEAIANEQLVLLGPGSEEYLPHQSIRTLTNLSTPGRNYLKVPISILNTSVYRGLPLERTRNASALSQWLLDLAANDPFLRDECKSVLLGEVVSITCAHPFYSNLKEVPYQYNELFGLIVRESLAQKLDAGERALPLAALFHRTRDGHSILKAVIQSSSLSTEAWIDKFLEVTLFPLFHFLFKYGFVFSPHGQNALIALVDNQPTRLVVKDFVDDATLSIDPLPEHKEIPPQIYDLLDSLEAPVLIQWIQTGLFVCVFRYMTEILVDDGLMDEAKFWKIAAGKLAAYQERFPELGDRFKFFDLTREAIPKLCLNSTRLVDIGYADSAERPVASVNKLIENPFFKYSKSAAH